MGLGILAASTCAGANPRADSSAPQTFYTVTAEIALARGEPRIAALQYAAAARHDPALLPRAAQVALEGLQPSLAASAAGLWLRHEPHSAAAHRAAAAAALALDQVTQAVEQYRFVLAPEPEREAEFGRLEAEMRSGDNAFGARRLADLLAAAYPQSPAALRLEGFAALRADDPAAAAHSFEAALARPDIPAESRLELTEALVRARVLAGDLAPLDELEAKATQGGPAARLDYALELIAAHRDEAARPQLTALLGSAESRSAALRILGLLEFQAGHWDQAGARFTELVAAGRDVDDAFYYLGLVAEKHDDPERALRLYSRVQKGEFVVSALLQAAALLHAHGAAADADRLYDQLAQDEPERAPEILAARARVYAADGDASRALATLDHGLAEYPDSVELRYARASRYEDLGRSAAALRELDAIARQRPQDPAALNALGYTLADHSRQLPRARALIERAYVAAPKNAAFRDSMGWVMYRQGLLAEALPLLSSAYADEHDGDIAAHLGEVLWRLGKTADAERIWSQAIEADPANQLIKSTRLRLHVQ
jgi:tetratricopeptide (TPR) repeat protein